MQTAVKIFLEKFSFQLLSLVIVFFISLQTITGFGIFSSLFSAALYPFVAYGMYKRAHYEGEKINIRYYLIGIFEDSKEMEIPPEDLGLTIFQFERVVKLILNEDVKRLQTYIRFYEEKHGGRLMALRLEERPYILKRDGILPGSTKTLRTMKIEADRENN